MEQRSDVNCEDNEEQELEVQSSSTNESHLSPLTLTTSNSLPASANRIFKERRKRDDKVVKTSVNQRVTVL